MLYVNRGIGLEPRPAPQVRFCARPEIVIFDIVPEK
jgi:predicted MPP superfamily phosphohydrolase